MMLYFLPSSARAIVDSNGLAPALSRPPKPRRLCLSLGLKTGLQDALEGKAGQGIHIRFFYLNTVEREPRQDTPLSFFYLN